MFLKKINRNQDHISFKNVDKNKKITGIKSKFAEKLDDIGAKIERQ